MYTFLVIVLVWVPFRIENISDSLLYYKRLFAFDFEPVHFAAKNFMYVILLLALLFSMITLTNFGKKLQYRIYKTNLSDHEHIGHFVFSIVMLFLSIASLAGWGFSPFIYFKF